MPRSLSEQAAVVTGASSGIGRATALVNLMGRVHGAAAALPQLAALQHWAPALTDRLMSIGKVGFSGQKTGEPDTGTDNLRAGAPGPGTVRGGYNGRVLERTRYTELLGQRPNARRAACSGAAVLCALLVRKAP